MITHDIHYYHQKDKTKQKIAILHFKKKFNKIVTQKIYWFLKKWEMIIKPLVILGKVNKLKV